MVFSFPQILPEGFCVEDSLTLLILLSNIKQLIKSLFKLHLSHSILAEKSSSKI